MINDYKPDPDEDVDDYDDSGYDIWLENRLLFEREDEARSDEKRADDRRAAMESMPGLTAEDFGETL